VADSKSDFRAETASGFAAQASPHGAAAYSESEFLALLGDRVRGMRLLREMSRRELARKSRVSDAISPRSRPAKATYRSCCCCGSRMRSAAASTAPRQEDLDGKARSCRQGHPRAVADAVGGGGQSAQGGAGERRALAARTRPPRQGPRRHDLRRVRYPLAGQFRLPHQRQSAASRLPSPATKPRT